MIKNQLPLSRQSAISVITLFSVFAPHAASELLQRLFDMKLEGCVWPEYNPNFIVADEVCYAVSINGKHRANLTVERNLSQDDVTQQAQGLIEKWLEQKKIIKIIFVQDRMVNFVVA